MIEKQTFSPNKEAWRNPSFAALVSRFALAVAQLVTMACMMTLLSPHEQGYVVTARSMLALQIALEFGLSGVLVQVVVHEHARLEMDAQHIPRIDKILRFAIRWYAVLAVFVVISVASAGGWVLSSQKSSGLMWQFPWILSAILSATSLLLLPFQAAVEGTGRIISIALMRGTQALAGSLAFFAVARRGGGLWSLPALLGTMLVTGIFWLVIRHKNDIRSMLTPTTSDFFCWRTEMLPFQWRIGVSWISGWLAAQVLVPILFLYRGAVEAGQLGLTMEAFLGITSIGAAWVGIRSAVWGRLIALKQFKELDLQYARSSRRALGVVATFALLFLVLIVAMRFFRCSLAGRFLPTVAVIAFSIAAIFNQQILAMAVYLRAHKKDPYCAPSVVGAIVMLLWALLSVPHWGAIGFAYGYLASVILIGWVWGRKIFKCFQKQHHAVE